MYYTRMNAMTIIVLSLFYSSAYALVPYTNCSTRPNCTQCQYLQNVVTGTPDKRCAWCSSGADVNSGGVCIQAIQVCPGNTDPTSLQCTFVGDNPDELLADNNRRNDSFIVFLVSVGVCGATALVALILLKVRYNKILAMKTKSR